jgi:hypothetical protein
MFGRGMRQKNEADSLPFIPLPYFSARYALPRTVSRKNG